MYKRGHPVSILSYMYKYLFLLLIPFIRGLITYRGGFYSWLKGTWLDILVVIFITLISVIRWMSYYYCYDINGLHVKKGVFLKFDIFIRPEEISTITAEQSLFLRTFNAVRISAVTDAEFFWLKTFTLTVPYSDADFILDTREQSCSDKNYLRRTYHPGFFHVAFLSAVLSNTLTGVLFFSAVINKIGVLFGEDFRSRLVGTLTETAEFLAFGIPPLSALISLIILAGWFISFVKNVLRHNGFKITRKNCLLYIKSGLITTRHFSCKVNRINFVDIRQSIISKLFHLHIVLIRCIGYGKRKDNDSVLIPAASTKSLSRQLEDILPEFKIKKRQLKPKPGAVIRYCLIPFLFAVILPLTANIMADFFKNWSQTIIFAGFILILPCIWLFLLNLINFFTTGIACGSNNITIRYSYRFCLHTVIIPNDRISLIGVSQNIFQKSSGGCDLTIYSYNDIRTTHKIKSFNLKEIVNLIDSIKIRVRE